ncbi:MAG: CoA pyrophosphatase [Marinoscillum sp.]|uniref:NUDIX hydrolase n=1 Tax=Marinoscillum sp. TaxID=2024838 RepID=UPI0032FBAC75
MQALINRLRIKLNQPLPGALAHNLMIPKLPTGNRVNFKFDKAPRKGAVLILLYEKEGIIRFPMIQRPLYEGVHSGQMALPGGRYEESDGDLEITALRETHEEIGVEPAQVNILGHLSEFMVSASNHLIVPYVGFSNEIPRFIPDQIEVDEIIEAPLAQLLDKGRLKEKEIITAHGYRLHSPYFDIQDKVVWGATAMMLSEFAAIIEDL